MSSWQRVTGDPNPFPWWAMGTQTPASQTPQWQPPYQLRFQLTARSAASSVRTQTAAPPSTALFSFRHRFRRWDEASFLFVCPPRPLVLPSDPFHPSSSVSPREL
eukprot:GGOE01065444.1.p6 GENE.GGOE01065444.1~~GGOE01065444.1.p6  ORF type:complete len:105 (+),score=8.31 GGOE01065444.1:224-538(+)